MAKTSLSVLMMKDLTSSATSISSISAAIKAEVANAMMEVNEVAEDATNQLSQQLGLSTIAVSKQ